MGFRETLELVVKLTDKSSPGVSRVIRNIRKVEASVGSTSKTFATLGTKSTDSYRALETATRRAGREQSAVARINAQTARQAVHHDNLRMRSARTLAQVQVKEQRRTATEFLRTSTAIQKAERVKAVAKTERSDRRMQRAGAIGGGLSNAGMAATAAISVPLVGLAVNAFRAAASMDSLEKGLTAINKGDVAATTKKLEELLEVAKLPGLGFREAVVGQTNLQAAGIEAKLATRLLKGFGNALATLGKGKAEFDGVQLALTQIASKSKISAEEINQLAGRVPQIREIMKAAFGTSDTEKLQKMGIKPITLLQKITDELEKLPSVSGGAANSVENLEDSWDKLNVVLGRSFLPKAVRGLEKLEGGLNKIETRFDALTPAQKDTTLNFALAAAAGGPLLLITGALVSSLTTLGGATLTTVRWLRSFSGAASGTATELVNTQSKVGGLGGSLRALPTVVKVGVAVVGIELAIQNIRELQQAMSDYTKSQEGVNRSGAMYAKSIERLKAQGLMTKDDRRGAARQALSALNQGGSNEMIGALDARRQTMYQRFSSAFINPYFKAGQSFQPQKAASVIRERAPVLEQSNIMLEFRKAVQGLKLDAPHAAKLNEALAIAYPKAFAESTAMLAADTAKVTESLAPLSKVFSDLYSPSAILPGVFDNAGNAATNFAFRVNALEIQAPVWPAFKPDGIPQSARGSIIQRDGLVNAHRGNVLTPASLSRRSPGDWLKDVSGIGLAEVRQPAAVQESSSNSLSFAPTINIHGGGGGNAVEVRAQVKSELERHEKELWRRFEQMQARRKERA
jgi:tape measure domain-containing protein